MRYSGPPTWVPAARSAQAPSAVERDRAVLRFSPSAIGRVYSRPGGERIASAPWTARPRWRSSRRACAPGSRRWRSPRRARGCSTATASIAIAAPACPDRSVVNSVSYADADALGAALGDLERVLRRVRRRRLDGLGARVRRRRDRGARGERQRPRRRPGGDEPRPRRRGSRSTSATSSGTTRSRPPTSAGSTTPPTASRRRPALARALTTAAGALPAAAGARRRRDRRACSATIDDRLRPRLLLRRHRSRPPRPRPLLAADGGRARRREAPRPARPPRCRRRRWASRSTRRLGFDRDFALTHVRAPHGLSGPSPEQGG